jgi:hypothetical protein
MSAVDATMIGADRVRAGTARRWELSLRAREPLETGASIRLSVPLGWTPPSLGEGKGLTTWRVAGRALVLGEIARRRYIQLNVTGGRLRPNDAIFVTYGAGTEGAVAQPWVTDIPATFDVEISRDGVGAYVPDGAIPVAVEPGSPAHLHVVIPSGAKPGVDVPVRIRVLDEYGNLCPSCSDEALLTGQHALPIEEGCGTAEIHFRQEGVHRIHAAATRLGLSGRSNPCMVEADAATPFWGDPHVHTVLSDGVASPEFALQYARDISCLDFTAITDHDVEFHHAWFTRPRQRLSDDEWGSLGRTIQQYRSPGKFAVLRGYEWTGRPHGDRCVYLRRDGSQIRRFERGDAPTLEALWRTLQEGGPGNAVVVPHTSASGFMGTDWSEHDPDLERLTEVYSMHGSSEHAGCPLEIHGAVHGQYLQDALARGYRLGLVGGGDMHSSQPGNPLLAIGPYRTLRRKPGLTAVLAGRLDEDSIIDALLKRHVYATTGARILLWFSANGSAVGEELIVSSGEQVVVQARIHGTAQLAEVTVVRDGTPAFVAQPQEEDAEFSWRDPSPPLAGRASYYYLRVLQVDGEMAWSSPIWMRLANA